MWTTTHIKKYEETSQNPGETTSFLDVTDPAKPEARRVKRSSPVVTRSVRVRKPPERFKDFCYDLSVIIKDYVLTWVPLSKTLSWFNVIIDRYSSKRRINNFVASRFMSVNYTRFLVDSPLCRHLLKIVVVLLKRKGLIRYQWRSGVDY